MPDSPRGQRGQFALGNTAAKKYGAVETNPAAGKSLRKVQELPHADGWESALTSIGTSRDKRQHTRYHTRLQSWEEILELYRTNDLAQRAIESPVKEAFRQGYEFSIADEGDYDDLKELLESEFIRLEVDKYVERAMCVERAFGGSALLMGINDGRDYSQPLDVKGIISFDWISVLEPVELWANTYYDDPHGPKYGEIETYRVSALGIGAPGTQQAGRLPPPDSQVIHESRLVVFTGRRVSRYQRQSNFLGVNWGDSMLLAIYDALRDFDSAFASAGILAVDFSQSVFSMKNLASLVSREPNKLQARMAALELGRSTARAVLVDTDEKFERQSTKLNGFPELLDRLASRLAAAVDMPISLLMGQSPGSIGDDGSADVRYYYDRIRSFQRRVVGPILRKIAVFVMAALRKQQPKKWGIKFQPLWQLDDEELANARLTQARTDTLNWKAGMISSDELRNSRFKGEYSFETQIDSSKKAPGQPPLPAQSPPIAPPGGWPPGHPLSGKPFPTPPPGGPADRTGAPVKAAGGGHVVGGYARRNPIKKAPDQSVANGGAAAPDDTKGGDVSGNKGRPKLGRMDAGGAGGGMGGAEGVFVGGVPTPPAGTRERRLKDAVDRLARADAGGYARALADVVAAAMSAHEDTGITYHDGRWHADGFEGSYPSESRARRRLRQDTDGAWSTPQRSTFAGLPILIENPVGTTRYWVDTDGTPGSTLMQFAYGCIEGAVGADDDDVDVYLGPDVDAPNAYVVHQQSKASGFAEYDEDKVMLGFTSAAAAAAAYLQQYDDPRFFGGMDVLPMDELRGIVLGDPGDVGKITGAPVMPARYDDDTARPPGKEINLEGYEIDNGPVHGYPLHSLTTQSTPSTPTEPNRASYDP